MSSLRLPAKVLKKIGDESVLSLLIKRCQKVKSVSTVIVVTSDRSDDNEIEAVAERLFVPCFRGSLDDVLKRFIDAAEHYDIQHILRVCADGPFRLPEIMDRALGQHVFEGNDYTDAVDSIFFSAGLGIEVVTLNALKQCYKKSSLKEDREHVTFYIRKHMEEFKYGLFKSAQEYQIEGLRLLIDTEEDYANIIHFVSKLPPQMRLEDIGLREMRAAFSQ